MTTSRRGRLALASALLATPAAALAVSTLPTADAAAIPHAVRTGDVPVHITQGRLVKLPAIVSPGVNRFSVTSKAVSLFQLARLRKGYTTADAARDINASLGSFAHPDLAALKRFEANTVLLGGVHAGPRHDGVMWAKLVRGGRYVALDENQTPAKATRMTNFAARGHRTSLSFPGGAKVTAIHEIDWAKRPRRIAHDGVLRFVNKSEDNHFIVMARFKKHATQAQVAAWIKKGAPNKGAPLRQHAGLDTGVVSGGHRFAVPYDLHPGRYEILCFWPDADMGGTPHAFMGMYRKITLR